MNTVFPLPGEASFITAPFVSSLLTIVIATYNERQSLPGLVEGLGEHLPDARILIVDDNSPDGTGQWVRQAAADRPQLELMHRSEKQGLGTATLSGIRHAMQQGSDWIATMDADGSHRPQDMALMWSRADPGDVDVIIGSRYAPGGKIQNWSLKRRIASRLVNSFARWVLWLPAWDNSGAARIYRAEFLRQVDLDQVDCSGFVYLEQILVHLNRAGARLKEVPIVFVERQSGKSKVGAANLFRNLRDILWLAMRRR